MSISGVQSALVDLLKDVSWTDSQGNTRGFDKVAQQEPANSPGKGIYAALWFDDIRPSADLSSLSKMGMLYTYNVRMYRSVNTSPGDSIDPDLVAATDAVLAAIAADSLLGGTAYVVDLLGAHSGGVQATTDYVDFGANAWYRVVDLTLPIVVDGVASYG